MRLLVYSNSESDSVKRKFRFNPQRGSVSFKQRLYFTQTELLFHPNRAFISLKQSLCFTRAGPLFSHSTASVRPAPRQACRTIFILLYLFVCSVRLTSFPIARRPPPDDRSLRASAPLSGRNVHRALRSSTRHG